MMSKLIGKTISNIKIRKKSEDYDDEPYLDLFFTDGTIVTFVATYGRFTGKSEEEYPCYIKLSTNLGSKE